MSRNHMKISAGYRVFTVFNTLFMLFLLVIILVITGALSLIRELISRIKFTRRHAADCNSSCFFCPFYIFCSADNEESSAQADAALK